MPFILGPLYPRPPVRQIEFDKYPTGAMANCNRPAMFGSQTGSLDRVIDQNTDMEGFSATDFQSKKDQKAEDKPVESPHRELCQGRAAKSGR
jgi:hypothetical protein